MIVSRQSFTRRGFLRAGTLTGAAIGGGLIARPALVRAESALPKLTHGLQSGDVGTDSAMLWARADRPARMLVDLSTTESFANVRTIRGPAMLEDSDFTGKLLVGDLPAGQRMFYRVRLQSLDDVTLEGEPAVGSFATASAGAEDVSFVWSGDTAGQGWGINLDWGGMRIYQTMHGLEPDFFLHCGDTIYADNAIAAEVALPDGSLWTNLVTEEVAKVAETLAEFRGRYQYNLMDANVRAFNARVPIIAQWDDHETTNNWYPNEVLADERYAVSSVGLLAARANKAFLEYMPIAQYPDESERIYRTIRRGPLMDLFVIDMRSYRADNSANDQPEPGPETEFLGRAQINWLKRQLLLSNATWKVIASDMPIGMIVRDGDSHFENLANGNGAPMGREHEIVELLRFIRDSAIENVVWLTADVHYTAAHYYDPNRAQFQDFTPFWEFVSGPLNAGTFGPSEMDDTFGPQVMFSRHPSAEQGLNLPPSAGLQFFGHVHIDAASEVMTVMLKDLEGSELYAVELEPQRGRAVPVWRQASAG
ncbi:MAG: alkaline phosphatase D family protein [Alphaproteobacteria bacterium]